MKRLYVCALLFICAVAPAEDDIVLMPTGQNGLEIPLPTWYVKETADLHRQLRMRLSQQDYTEVLMGELGQLCDNRKIATTPDSYAQQDLIRLKQGLQNILEDPKREETFARAHFLESHAQGVCLREHLQNTMGELFGADEHYILTRSRGVSGGESALMRFWDSRTYRLVSAWTAPSLIREYAPAPQSGIYYFAAVWGGTASVPHFADDWAGNSGTTYFVRPAEQQQQSMPRLVGNLNIPEEVYQNGLLTKASGWEGEPDGFSVSSAGPDESVLRTANVVRNFHEAEWDEDFNPTQEMIWAMSFNEHSLHAELPGGRHSLDFDFRDLQSRPLVVPTPVSPDILRPALDKVAVVVWHGPSAAEEPVPCTESVLTSAAAEGWFAFGCQAGIENQEVGYIGVADAQGTAYLLPPIMKLTAGKKGRLAPLAEEERELFRSSFTDDCGMVLKKEKEWRNFACKLRLLSLARGKRSGSLELVLTGQNQSGVVICAVLDIDSAARSYEVRHVWKCKHTSLIPLYLSSVSWFLKPLDETSYSIIPIRGGQEQEPLARLFLTRSGGYAVVLNDGRYAGSPGCESFLQISAGEKTIGMEALAPWRNRPAEVLQAIGGDSDAVAALRSTTERWLSRRGFDPNHMPAEPKLEDFPSLDVALPPLFSSAETLSFPVTLQAASHPINKLIVRVDGTLIPQRTAPAVSPGQQEKLMVTLPLIPGENRIELTPVDSAGIAGETFRFRHICRLRKKSELYIVALGVSAYRNEDLHLEYAAKDACDVCAALQQYGAGHQHTLCLTDAEVTGKDVLPKVKDFLAGAKENDRVVFYVAGHGMLDEKLDYFFAPVDFNPEHIADTGIPMDALTSCLTECKARRRLLMLDTCHAGIVGERDEERLAALHSSAPSSVRFSRFRGMRLRRNYDGLTTRGVKRYVEEMFARGRSVPGVNIIAAAAGAEAALESPHWKNGAFAACLLELLNRKSPLPVQDLANALKRNVYTLTDGIQSPELIAGENSDTMYLCTEDAAEAQVDSHPEQGKSGLNAEEEACRQGER